MVAALVGKTVATGILDLDTQSGETDATYGHGQDKYRHGQWAGTLWYITWAGEQVSWQAECLGAGAGAGAGAEGAGDPLPGTGRGAHLLWGSNIYRRVEVEVRGEVQVKVEE